VPTYGVSVKVRIIVSVRVRARVKIRVRVISEFSINTISVKRVFV